MKNYRPFTCRGFRSRKRWAAVTLIAMLLSMFSGPGQIGVNAQLAPVGAGFSLDAGDLRFIYQQIQIAQAHVAGGQLVGPGPNQIPDPRLPFGLRTVDGSMNHLGTGQTGWGAADRVFPRLTTPSFRPAANGTTYTQKSGTVVDPEPRIISNLISDQTVSNPAAVEVSGYDPLATGPDAVVPEPLGTLPIGNVAPDVGLSAPFNSMLTFFGQFFDHGLDLVPKSGGTVFVPLPADDPLIAGADGIPGNADDIPPALRFMALTRATNQAGPNGIVGDADDVQEAVNLTTSYVDQNQTYTSHPAHQVFLREYELSPEGRPVATGRFIDGGGDVNGVPVRNIGNWAEVKAQAESMLGIRLEDSDVFNVPLVVTDPYGRFRRGPNGYPMLMMANNTLVEGNPEAPVTTAGARRTGHAFLDDIAHNAVPNPGLRPDDDRVVGAHNQPQPAGTYDNELLDAHFVTGDGRGNENIALTAVHTVFHSEHNRLANEIPGLIDTLLTPAERAAWHAVDTASGWDFGERLFQAARFVTEMEYQHLVFEEFARKIAPSINEFMPDGINFQPHLNPSITAEFAHAVYRLGHSMLTETISRVDTQGRQFDIDLMTGFLNPLEFNHDGLGGRLTASQAAGAIFEGGARQIASEIDEFITEALRNRLLGLPLDLGVLNLARGRSEGLPPLNSVRQQLFASTGDPALLPYASWYDFLSGMRNAPSLVNFIAAYGTGDAELAAATTMADKRARAEVLAEDFTYLLRPGSETGVDRIDLWIGGLAEKIAPFGGMLGTTFNFVFETQLENLQNADRFYYLERLDGLNLLTQLEANSFVELVARNTTMRAGPADIFSRPDLVINLANVLNAAGTAIVDDPTTPDDERTFLVLANGTIRYTGPLHVNWIGSPAGDRTFSSEGDDTMRGNDGNDVMEGGAGNDQHIGGAGNDILTDNFGEDVMKGGPGNDVIFGGLGPFDLLQGNEGHDYIVAGNDMSEIFGGAGNDIMYTGDGATESFGGHGDDWIEGGNQLNLLVGDENNQFQNDPHGGHDVIIGGSGDDDFDAEGGDDIMVTRMQGIDRLEGMLGYDWVTYRGDTEPVDADMNITGLADLVPNVNELRDRMDLTEGLSGYNLNDKLAGDDRTEADLLDGIFGQVPNGQVLTSAGIDRIAGLRTLVTGLLTVDADPAIPGLDAFAAGNILLGGAGSDRLEGRGGNDVLDGDRWLNVQLEATLNNGQVRLVDRLRDLQTEARAGLLNPGNVRIIRSIVTTGASANDIDTAVFSGAQNEYTVTTANGVTTVVHNIIDATGAIVTPGGGIDGTDTLRNIERLVFRGNVVNVPAVTTLTEAQATTAIINAGLEPGTVTFAFNAAPAGQVFSQTPAANTAAAPLSQVSFVVSLGPQPVVVPSVQGLTAAQAQTRLQGFGLLLGAVTQASSSQPINTIISQVPFAGGTALPGSQVSVVVSSGAPPTGLVLDLGFNEAQGTTATDASANPRNGTILGATRVPGVVGTALSFDGVDDWVTVTDVTGSKLDLTTGMTLQAWVNPGTLSGWETVLMKERGAGALSYGMYARDGAPFAGGFASPAGYLRAGGADRIVRGVDAIPAGAWTHLATTYDGAFQRFYVNGAEVAAVPRTGTIVAGNQPLRIGGNGSFTGEFFQGLIDEVRVYNRALTAGEIATYYATTAPGTGGDVTNPTVAFTAPAANATVSGAAVNVAANATDNVGVLSVTFEALNTATNVVTPLGSDSTATGISYSVTWNTTGVPNGPYQLRATAVDAAGNQSLATRNVTVNNVAPDTTAPTVAITAPTAGQTISGTFTVAATANDNVGVAAVEFAVDGGAFGSADTTAPYQFAWNTTGLANGNHTVSARARDAANNLSTVASVTVNVNNVAAGSPVAGAAVVSSGVGQRSVQVTTTAPNTVLVAFSGADGPNQNNAQTITLTSTGATFTQVQRSAGRRGVAQIWVATVAAPSTVTINTNTPNNCGANQACRQSLTVVPFTSAAGVGASGVSNSGGVNSAQSVTLNAQAAGSLVFGVGLDWNASGVRTVGANQTKVSEHHVANIITTWVQRANAATTTAGQAVTLTATPNSPEWNMAIVEVRGQ